MPLYLSAPVARSIHSLLTLDSSSLPPPTPAPVPKSRPVISYTPASSPEPTTPTTPTATMAPPTFEEMEAKRQEMITSFKDIAAAMTRCVSIIEDYTRLTPSSVTDTTAHANGLPLTSATETKPDEEVKKPKAKREKKIKDPNAPKRPPSAYILFQNEIRDELRRKNPDLPYKGVLAMIAERWKSLPESQKQVFEEAYSDANKSFKVLDEAYKSTGQPATPAPAPAAAPVSPDSSSDDSSDEDSSDESEAVPAPAAAPVPKATPKSAPPPATIAPQTLSAAVAAATAATAAEKPKKEKKRKNKDDEAVVAAALQPEPEKKVSKKKKKEAAA